MSAVNRTFPISPEPMDVAMEVDGLDYETYPSLSGAHHGTDKVHERDDSLSDENDKIKKNNNKTTKNSQKQNENYQNQKKNQENVQNTKNKVNSNISGGWNNALSNKPTFTNPKNIEKILQIHSSSLESKFKYNLISKITKKNNSTTNDDELSNVIFQLINHFKTIPILNSVISKGIAITVPPEQSSKTTTTVAFKIDATSQVILKQVDDLMEIATTSFSSEDFNVEIQPKTTYNDLVVIRTHTSTNITISSALDETISVIQQYGTIIQQDISEIANPSFSLRGDYKGPFLYFLVNITSGSVPPAKTHFNTLENDATIYFNVNSNYRFCQFCRSNTHHKTRCPFRKDCPSCRLTPDNHSHSLIDCSYTSLESKQKAFDSLPHITQKYYLKNTKKRLPLWMIKIKQAFLQEEQNPEMDESDISDYQSTYNESSQNLLHPTQNHIESDNEQTHIINNNTDNQISNNQTPYNDISSTQNEDTTNYQQEQTISISTSDDTLKRSAATLSSDEEDIRQNKDQFTIAQRIRQKTTQIQQ